MQEEIFHVRPAVKMKGIPEEIDTNLHILKTSEGGYVLLAFEKLFDGHTNGPFVDSNQNSDISSAVTRVVAAKQIVQDLFAAERCWETLQNAVLLLIECTLHSAQFSSILQERIHQLMSLEDWNQKRKR